VAGPVPLHAGSPAQGDGRTSRHPFSGVQPKVGRLGE
jgi:hypothetical protein